uniref:Phospholipase A2 inhibitor N-terminal domain-containing protein n=1 Tax=Oryctolagus cuniculus TaxID=9986 RepID=A0A5F9DD18_RABIT
MRPSTRPGHFLLALTLLCTLPGLGRPLTCEVCKGSGPTCSGRMKTCEAGKDACVVLVGESSTKGSQSVGTLKACVKFSDCYSGFVSTTMSRDDYMVSNAHCCQTDGCNQGSVPPPQNNRTENGRMCPSCIAPFQETCPGTRGVRCVGQETHCIYFAGNVQAGEAPLAAGRRGRELGGAENLTSPPNPPPRYLQHQICHAGLCHRERLLHEGWRGGALGLLSLFPAESRLPASPLASRQGRVKNPGVGSSSACSSPCAYKGDRFIERARVLCCDTCWGSGVQKLRASPLSPFSRKRGNGSAL